jgi:crossover junction endodeoxyribonuclease RusA
MSQRIVTADEYRQMAGGAKVRFGRAKPKSDRPLKREKTPEPKLCDSYRIATEPITVKLAWPPSVNNYWRSAVIGGHVSVYIDRPGKAYRQLVIAEWLNQAGKLTFDGRLALRIEAVYPDNIRRDLDNLCKAVLDSLAHAGAFRDDSQIRLLIVEQETVQAPGWINVTIGAKPGCDQQRSLFEAGF